MVITKVRMAIVNWWFLMKESGLDVQMVSIVVQMEIVRESPIIIVMMATINNEDQLSDIPSNNGKDTTSNRFSSSGTSASIPLSPSIVTASESTPGKCDDSLWNHVYNPSRLQIVDKCITVTGIIDSIRSEQDGDLHIRLKLDPSHSHLVNQANEKTNLEI